MRGAVSALAVAVVLPVAVALVSPAIASHAAGTVAAAPVAAAPSEGPEGLGELVTAAPPSGDVRGWWESLSPDARERLVGESPELVGNLDGVPYDVRDRVNREVLARDIAAVRESLELGIGKAASQSAAQRLGMLREIEEALESQPGTPQRRLLVLDTSFPGKAAISLGDLGAAEYVSVLVPGALLSVREHMSEWTKVTADLYASQQEWQSTFGDRHTVATVSWIGYQTPDITNAIGLELAEEGASALSSFINGIKSLRDGDEPFISVLAHSYGATATTLALGRGWMTIDALAMMGSPGGDVASVADLAIPGDRVWVGEAVWDPIVNSAFFGADPGAPAFGAKRMNVSGSADPVTGAVLTASFGHDWYLEPGTESLRNLALIGIDRGEFVTDGGPDDELKTLALLDSDQ